MQLINKSLFFFPVLFHASILICCTFREVSTEDFTIDLDPYWELFKKIYSKIYEEDQEDDRRKLWESRILDLFLHNLYADLGFQSYRRGVNAYSDLTDEEREKYLKGFKDPGPQGNCSKWVEPSNLEHPDSVDWRDEGLVTSVKNQGRCGACWAFSALASLEGQHKKKTGDLVSLSAQQLVDCDTEVNQGCDGGFMTAAYEYIRNSEGMNSESAYPYKEEQGECKLKPENVVAMVTGCVTLPEGDEDALFHAVATMGPISVGIDSKHEGFMSYKSGVYEEPNCSNQMDHAVLLVGFGTEDGMDYWLIKNSWGESWGMKGYMKIARNKNNMCGIASKASYPLV